MMPITRTIYVDNELLYALPHRYTQCSGTELERAAFTAVYSQDSTLSDRHWFNLMAL